MGGAHSHGHAHHPAHGHAHSSTPGSSVAVEAGATRVLFGFLTVCAIAAIVGLVVLWPDHAAVAKLRAQAQYTAPGVTFQQATVTTVRKPCPTSGADAQSTTCGTITATITTGPDAGRVETVGVPPAVLVSGLGSGDGVRLMRIPATGAGSVSYAFDDVSRGIPLWVFLGAFVLVVALVARLRGLLALVGLAVGAGVLLWFMLPALLSGSSGMAVALTGSTAIMFVVLYVAHGPSVRTSAALAGTLIGIGITAVIGQAAISGATLSGFSDESSALLSAFATDISFRGLLTCGLVVAGLGVLNDVTITQASAVWELREAGPDLSRRQLFTSAMRIGRDHIASTIYTIVFAYAGSALAVLLLLSLYDRPLGQLLTSEAIAEEIVRTLASAIGLVLAVPITTAIAVLTVAGQDRSSSRIATG
jgi:uncharacterized membrane protein